MIIVGEAEIYIGKDPYRGTPAYFSRIQQQYQSISKCEGIPNYVNDTDAQNKRGFSMTCINLLRCAPGKAELLLQEHFHEGVRHARRELASNENDGVGEISILNFD